jgi:hypothetical protein
MQMLATPVEGKLGDFVKVRDAGFAGNPLAL